jgi:PPOX class probable F420-dependent enzyme
MSRRDQIRMTDQEVDEFLHGRRVMNIATLGKTGHPHLVAMWYGFLRGEPALWTYGRSQKVVNVERDPRITGLVEEGETYDQLVGVELVGHAEVIIDTESTMELGRSVWERYWGEVNDDVDKVIAERGAKRVAVVIHVDDVVSWDHRKLGGTY